MELRNQQSSSRRMGTSKTFADKVKEKIAQNVLASNRAEEDKVIASRQPETICLTDSDEEEKSDPSQCRELMEDAESGREPTQHQEPRAEERRKAVNANLKRDRRRVGSLSVKTEKCNESAEATGFYIGTVELEKRMKKSDSNESNDRNDSKRRLIELEARSKMAEAEIVFLRHQLQHAYEENIRLRDTARVALQAISR